MSQEEFVNKWRGELFALIFEAEVSGPKLQRLRLLDKSETILRAIYAEMNVPPGPVPENVLQSCRVLFGLLKKELALPLIPEKLKLIPFDAPDKKLQ